MKAWLEHADGTLVEIATDCYIGRVAGNQVRIDSPKVSRRHAHIHGQQSGGVAEYWIADLGSTNGTIRNGRRVTIPVRLTAGDVITIGDARLVFRLEADGESGPASEDSAAATVSIRDSRPCWLLMVDIKSYTSLSHRLDEEALGRTVGAWLRQCRDAIESAGGTVDKFLGDAIFAYWFVEDRVPAQVAQAVRALQRVQQTRNPDFRIILHQAPVMLEGAAGGANNLFGLEVIFVFRMEKTCAGLGLDSLVSAPARAALAVEMGCAPLGEYPLDGFPGTHPMFRLLE